MTVSRHSCTALFVEQVGRGVRAGVVAAWPDARASVPEGQRPERRRRRRTCLAGRALRYDLYLLVERVKKRRLPRGPVEQLRPRVGEATRAWSEPVAAIQRRL
jgi:hypothetical protein